MKTIIVGLATATGLAFSCVFAQAQSAANSLNYAYCTGRSGPRNITATTKSTLYMSDVFSVPAASQGAIRLAFRQYLATQDKMAMAEMCIAKASQQEASTDKAANLTKLKALVQASGAVSSVQIVETGWKYQAPATTAATSSPSVPITSPIPAKSAAAPITSGTSSTPTSPATSVNSMGSSLAATGTNIQQSTMQSVNQASQNVQNSAAAAVGSTVDAASQKMTNAFQNGMTGLLNRKKTAPAAAVANANVSAPPPSRPETTSSVLPASYGLPPATAVPANGPIAPASTPSAKPIIQDEGDGKHWMLTIPGDPETHELTPVANSKTVFVEDSTGDKYILMPDGDVKHIPHKNVAK